MSDSGLPSDILNADGTRSVQTSTTNIGAYMWSAVVAERLGFIDKRELERRLRAHARARWSGWSARRHGRAVLQLVRPPHGREAHDLAADRRADLHPILSSVDNGWLAVGLRIVENTRPKLSRRAGALYASWTSASTTGPSVNRDPVPLLARHRRGALLLRHRRQREPDRRLHRDRARPAPAEGLLRRWRTFPRHL